MVKKSIFFASFLLALFTLISINQFEIGNQQNFPMNTSERFELNITNTKISKDKVVNDLNALVDKNKGILLKVVVNTRNDKDQKDIIWFGSKQPSGNNIVIIGKKISWLEPNLKGELIPSTEIGERPLYGMYSIKGSDNLKNDLNNWAIENELKINWEQDQNSFPNFYYFLSNGIGNAILTAFLLFLTTIIMWFVINSRSRSIRYQNGTSLLNLHNEDAIALCKISSIGYIVALLVCYIYIVNGINQLRLVLVSNIIGVIILIICTLILAFVISNIARPNSILLATRKIPFKKFKYLGVGTRVLSIFLSLIIIPTTITSAYIVNEMSNEYSLWNNLDRNVRLSFNELDILSTGSVKPKVESFFNEMEEKDNLSTSYVIDEAILLNKEEYGGYDHIIMADKKWVESFNIGINQMGENGMLEKVNFKSLDKSLQDFLNVQMPILTKTEEVSPKGIAFYEFGGNSFLALPPNLAVGGTTIQAKNPLVILVDSVSDLDTDSFLIPAISSGNIVFKDKNVLEEALTKYDLNEYITSVDTVADKALELAQSFKKEAIFYIMACIMVFLSMIFAGIMNSQLWVEENKKRVFILHTYGITYNEIMKKPYLHELIVEIVTIIIASICSFCFMHLNLLLISLVAILIILLYESTKFISYHVCAKRKFNQMARREG